MEWHYQPRERGIEITFLTHTDAMLGFLFRDNPLGFTINLFYCSLYVYWFDRKDCEEYIECLKED